MLSRPPAAFNTRKTLIGFRFLVSRDYLREIIPLPRVNAIKMFAAASPAMTNRIAGMTDAYSLSRLARTQVTCLATRNLR
jgi:hypothetical protein